MSAIIQCPECDKKFRLPAQPPATFTCNGCGTLMDLSDYAGGGAAPAPTQPARGAPGGGGPPRSRRTRARGGARRTASAGAPAPGRRSARGAGGARRRGGGRGRGPVDDEGYDDEPRGRGRRDGNNTLVISLVAALVVAIVVVVVVVTRDKGPVPGDGGTSTARGPDAAGSPTGGSGAEPTASGATPGAAADAAGGPAGTAPDDGSEGSGDGAAPPSDVKPGGRVRLSKVEFQTFPWPDEVSADTRAKVEEAIANLYVGGRDGLEAADWLVAQGRPICGRLISEFKTIDETLGLESREARSRLGAIDGVLRQIDGWIERRWKERKQIQAPSDPTFVSAILKRWTFWWGSGEWKSEPRKPWDPWEDESDESADGAKPAEKPKDDDEGGFDKPAGR